MKGFLVDFNLPRNTHIWRDDAFSFVVDIDKRMKDSEIWSYAKSNDLTILTKDSDFSYRVMISDPPPRIIHFQIGNMRLHIFKRFIDEHWEAIKMESSQNKLVTVFRKRIEVVK